MLGKYCFKCEKCFHCLSSLEEMTKGREMTEEDVKYNCNLWGGFKEEDFSKYKNKLQE